MVDEPKEEAVSSEKRRHQRVRVTKPVTLEATLRGRFIDIMRLEMSGVTIDMSEGGILANVDQSISPGVRCRIDLTAKDGDGPTESLWGRVRRTDMSKNGFVVAIEFDEPTKALEALGASTVDLELDVVDQADNGDGKPAEEEALEAAADGKEEAPAKGRKRKTAKKKVSKG